MKAPYTNEELVGKALDPVRGKIDETTTFDPKDFRNTVPRFNPENRKLNQAVVDLVKQIAEEKKVTPAVGVELTEDDLREIDACSSLARGARYSEGAQKMIDR